MELPTDGAHETTFMDAGNIYNRRFELGYVSSIYDAGGERQTRDVVWKADEPFGAKLRLELRGANSREELASTPWRPHAAEGRPARFWQYRAVFISADGSNYPVLREIKILFR
jgi:hypothetical protein